MTVTVYEVLCGTEGGVVATSFAAPLVITYHITDTVEQANG